MATNFSIDALSSITPSRIEGGGSSNPVTEARVHKEMQLQGMEAPTSDTGGSFSKILKDSFEKVNEFQGQADTAIKEMVAGRNKNIHETMLAVERADSSLKLMMQVRNKILDAYKEVMRMQV